MLLPEKCCALTRNDDNGNDVCMWGWENTWPLQPPARPLSSVVPWAFSWTSNDPLISSSGLIILFDPASNVILVTNCVFQINRLFADHVNRVMIVHILLLILHLSRNRLWNCRKTRKVPAWMPGRSNGLLKSKSKGSSTGAGKISWEC